MSELARPPVRLSLQGGGSVRVRRLPDAGGRALITADDGRFLLLPPAELDELERSPASAVRRRLESLGLVRSPGSPPRRGQPGPSRVNVELGGAPGAPRVVGEDEAFGRVDQAFRLGGRSIHLELRGVDVPSAEPLVRLVVERARARAVVSGVGLSLGVTTSLAGLGGETLDWLIEQGALFTVLFDGSPGAHEENRAITLAPPHAQAASALAALHRRHASRGLDPRLAYVTVASTVTSATLAAGPSALVSSLREAGAVYAQLRPLRPALASAQALASLACSAEAFRGFERALAPLVIEANRGEALFVEKRLALHLEALVARAAPASEAPGCDGCAHEPFCGSQLADHLLDDEARSRGFGGPFCQSEMASLDDLFALLASPLGPEVRSVFLRWQAARDAVARRLSAQ